MRIPIANPAYNIGVFTAIADRIRIQSLRGIRIRAPMLDPGLGPCLQGKQT
jgi:hypothetical protein